MMWMLCQAMFHVISYPVTPTPCHYDAKSFNFTVKLCFTRNPIPLNQVCKQIPITVYYAFYNECTYRRNTVITHREILFFRKYSETPPQNATKNNPFLGLSISRRMRYGSSKSVQPFRTRSVFLSWKISRFYILTEIAWGNVRNIFQLWGPITPKPHNRMYQLNVSCNYIHSSVCLQKISLIDRYLRPVMWWTTHTYV